MSRLGDPSPLPQGLCKLNSFYKETLRLKSEVRAEPRAPAFFPGRTLAFSERAFLGLCICKFGEWADPQVSEFLDTVA